VDVARADITEAELAARNKAVAKENKTAAALDTVIDTMAKRLENDKTPPDLRVAQEAIRAAETRREWAQWHRHQAERHRATLTDLICHHEREAARLE
jgi:hypothetical protein